MKIKHITMKKIALKIAVKNNNERIHDSAIIQFIERAKKERNFNINYYYYPTGFTLLTSAIDTERYELVEYLLTYPNIKVNNGFITLCFLCEDINNIHILKLFLNRNDLKVNKQDYQGCTGLHNACDNNKKEWVLELLLDARVDIMIRNYDDLSARDIAICWEYHDIANMIKRIGHTSLLRIPNEALCKDIARIKIEEYA